MMYTLYQNPYSQHARRVIALLEQHGLPYESRFVDMAQGEHLTAAYLAINPNHQVPTLIDGDLKIHESNAILRYLCARHELDAWYPQQARARAVVDQWLDWNQCRLGPAVIDIVLNRVFLAEQGDAAAIRRGEARVGELTPILDAALQSTVFLAGSQPTIADFALASNLFQLGLAEAKPQTVAIDRWYAGIEALPGYRASLPPD